MPRSTSRASGTGVRSDIHGERVEDVTRHPSLRKAIDHGAIDYGLDKQAELRDLLVMRSPETGNEIRRYFECPGRPKTCCAGRRSSRRRRKTVRPS